ncbi:MAG: hypothetical protein HY720_04705 [Planctomycetes bacterium]|nr:hypothetical protein [Planctomycetota bacterium]
MIEKRRSGEAAPYVAGILLVTVGVVAFLLFWPRRRAKEDEEKTAPPPPVGSSELENTKRETGKPHRVSQSVLVYGPLSATEYKFLSADALVSVHVVQIYRSTILEKTSRQIVEERVVESSGFLVLSVELTEHSLARAIETAGKLGATFAPPPYQVPVLVATRLLRWASDRAMQKWIEGKGAKEAEDLARELGLSPPESLRKGTRFPESLAGMKGRTYHLTYAADRPPMAEIKSEGDFPDEVKHFLERTSFFLDAQFFAHRKEETFVWPADRLHQYLFTSFFPEGDRLAVAGELRAQLGRPVRRPREEERTAFRLAGEVRVSVPSPEAGTRKLALAIDPEASFAHLGADSGYLREVEIHATGDFAHRALLSVLGFDTVARLEAKAQAEIAATMTCAPVE